MTFFSDQEPTVDVRGGHFVYTFYFENEKHHLVLTRHAAIGTAQLTLKSLDEEPRTALVTKLEDAAKREAAS